MLGAKKIRVFSVFFAVVIVTLFFVWTRLQNIRIRRDISRLQNQEAKLNVENNKLRLKLAQLTSPHRLEQIGMKKYNLKRPNPNQIIILHEP